MPLVKKSISVTESQNDWIKAQLASGHYGNESEVLRELIRERQLRQAGQQTPVQLEKLRAEITKGEESGFTHMSVDDIWNEARNSEKSLNEG